VAAGRSGVLECRATVSSGASALQHATPCVKLPSAGLPSALVERPGRKDLSKNQRCQQSAQDLHWPGQALKDQLVGRISPPPHRRVSTWVLLVSLSWVVTLVCLGVSSSDLERATCLALSRLSRDAPCTSRCSEVDGLTWRVNVARGERERQRVDVA
jgi:hypothetical protein